MKGSVFSNLLFCPRYAHVPLPELCMSFKTQTHKSLENRQTLMAAVLPISWMAASNQWEKYNFLPNKCFACVCVCVNIHNLRFFFSSPREEWKSLSAVGVVKHFAWFPAKYQLCFSLVSQKWKNESRKCEGLVLASWGWGRNFMSGHGALCSWWTSAGKAAK